MATPESILELTNELAKERTRAAAERTLSNWINNCILLIGFGVAVDQIQSSLERILLLNNTLKIAQLAHNICLIFIVFAIGVLVIVMAQHILILRSLRRRSQVFQVDLFLKLNQVTIAVVLVFGLLGLFMMLLKFS